jgi:hypothetical protein
MSRVARKWIAGTILFALAMREAGCWDVEYQRTTETTTFGHYTDPSPLTWRDICPARSPSTEAALRDVAAATATEAARIDCELSCEPEGAFCDGLREQLGCVRAERDGRPPSDVQLAIHVEHDGDPFCYLPVWKHNQVGFRVITDVTSAVAGEDAHERRCDRWRGDVERTAWGFGSCRGFRRDMGARAASSMTDQLISHVASARSAMQSRRAEPRN